MTNLKKAQDFVVENFLSDYPDDATYAEICDWLTEGTEDEDGAQLVTPWQVYEDIDIINAMDCMVDSVKHLLDAQKCPESVSVQLDKMLAAREVQS
jgi:hypothetical protein